MKKSNRHHSQPKMYLCPNWPGYWEQVHGFRKSFPNWVDFSCHKKRPPNGVSSYKLFNTGFYHFDMVNMVNLQEEAAAKVVGSNLDAQHRFSDQVQKLRDGMTNYFIISTGKHHIDGEAYIIEQIPAGETLFTYPTVLKTRERHVTIFVREEMPLMPDVLCNWMGKLSPVLFGFSANYLIPRNQWWSKSRVEKYFHY